MLNRKEVIAKADEYFEAIHGEIADCLGGATEEGNNVWCVTLGMIDCAADMYIYVNAATGEVWT